MVNAHSANRALNSRRGTTLSDSRITLLRAKADLADAIVTSARAQMVEAAGRPATPSNVSLYEGCKAGLARRQAEAAELRSQLIGANLICGRGA